MAIWFTSDQHFGHANIIALQHRPFNTVRHMNEVLIERWNEIVAPGDIIYHLGDFAMGDKNEWPGIVERLNGYKILVRGNHDGTITRMLAAGFDDVPKEANIVRAVEGVQVWMNHYPTTAPTLRGKPYENEIANRQYLLGRIAAQRVSTETLQEFRDWLRRRRASQGDFAYYRDWLDICANGIEAVATVFADSTEYGRYMRSVATISPFISQSERDLFYRAKLPVEALALVGIKPAKYQRPPAPKEYDVSLCGHVHSAFKVRDGVVNVGVDVWDFYPISLQQILAARE